MSARSRSLLAPTRWAVAAALTLLAAACGDLPTDAAPTPAPIPQRPDSTPTRVVTQLEIEATDAPLLLHGSRQLVVRARAADGTPMDGAAVAWTTSDSSVAIVTPQGVVVGQGLGEAVIAAVAGRARAERRVVVAPVPVARIELSRTSLTLASGEAALVGAVLIAPDGRVLLDREVTWTTSDTGIVVIDAYRGISARRVGTAIVTATSGEASARVRVHVEPAPVAGTYGLTVHHLAGRGTRCHLTGFELRLEQDGSRLSGEIVAAGPNAGSVGCTIEPGGQPPYETPLPPVGPVTGEVVGTLVLLHTELGRWELRGQLRAGARSIDGQAFLTESVDGRDVVRTGTLAAQRRS